MGSKGVIIVAGGSGRRMAGPRPKQFLFLGNLPVLGHTVNAFAEALPGAPIVVVLPVEHMDYWKNLAARFDVAPHILAEGGAERFHSVRNGLNALPADTEFIAVQDGVRPLVRAELIHRIFTAAENCGAAIPIVSPVDSFREMDGDNSHIVDRNRLRIVQTPQVFRADWLRQAYAADFRPEFTDDASVVEAAGYPVFLCEGARSNLKITSPEDLYCAAALLAAQRTQTTENEECL